MVSFNEYGEFISGESYGIRLENVLGFVLNIWMEPVWKLWNPKLASLGIMRNRAGWATAIHQDSYATLSSSYATYYATNTKKLHPNSTYTN